MTQEHAGSDGGTAACQQLPRKDDAPGVIAIIRQAIQFFLYNLERIWLYLQQSVTNSSSKKCKYQEEHRATSRSNYKIRWTNLLVYMENADISLALISIGFVWSMQGMI